MRKLLLICIGLFVFSCDSDSPTEPANTGLIDSVCGYDDFEYLTGCGNIMGGCSGTVSFLEDIAAGYCVMAGYTNAVSYDIITVGPVQNVLNIGCTYNENTNPDLYSCDHVGYCNENNPGAWGVSDTWPVISNLICE